jgi:peptidoglycan/LPS O-acetylase OafA/YrhL
MRDTSPAGTATNAGAYRPDIDGMRALAVGLVVLHHVGFHRVSGGYIGVDVFFVISGYLITSIIFPKIAERRFSYLDFFGRRVKRLSPVLSLVIAVTLAAGLVLLLPSDLEKLASSAVWVSLFAGNFFFWRNYGGYFADDAQSAPLLHTWSLAVEEQYYLLWPLSLVIALRLFGARNTVILICLAVPPLIYLSELGTRLTIGAAYYLLPTRFFELLVGSVAALLHLPERLALHRHVATLLGSAGLAAIVYAGITLTPASAFPGYNALWPVLGTLLVIVSTPGLANRALTAAPVVYLGKLSYSLYLWHWPIIACMHYTGLEFSLTARLLAMGGALLLSMASYHLVENPLRHRRYASRRQIFLWLYVAPTALIAAAALAILATQGLPQRFDAALVNADRAVATRVHQQRSACHVPARSWQQPLDADCVFGAGGAAAPTVLLIGDSHANHLVPFFEALLRDAGLQGNDYTMDRCPGLFGLEYGANAPIARQCAGRNALASMAIGERGYRYVVLAASWPDTNTGSVHVDGRRLTDDDAVEKALSAALRRTLTRITESGALPVLVRETPTLPGISPRCPLQVQLFGADKDCHARHYRNGWLDRSLPALQADFPTLQVLDPSSLLCDDSGRCAMRLEDLPLYSDDNHFNAPGSALLGEVYLREHGNPFIAGDAAQGTQP